MTNAEVDQPSTQTAPAAPIPKSPELVSLSSGYVKENHQTYLRHLQDAVTEPKNRNIALSGRYGTGKSSVLDEFAALNEKSTMRIAISTLGPDADGKGVTNRIQKELVKQLLYQAAPRQSRFSRFNRIIALSKTRAAIETSIAVVVVGAILASLGWLPSLVWTAPGHPWSIQVLSWVGFAVLAIAVLTTLRLVIYGRFLISDVSAAGATVKLTKDSSTYFDEYLEEIVYFFNQGRIEVVIFEDLDRFDDPHIFEAVRELNTLLNQTPKRAKENRPIRFIYAVKDSLFERLGTEVGATEDDDAMNETARANRTKFFDVVIPIVPFISHRNARELLASLIVDSGFTEIDRQLVALVAQYATDMRLLKNICNEYAVFAERLLLSGNAAPGLTPTGLFALVAYKNFHLMDFENIARRRSDLDTLYSLRRELVRTAIEGCERRRRDIINGVERFETRGALAKELGDRLITVGLIFKDASSYQGWPNLQFFAGTTWKSQDDVQSCSFWTEVHQATEILVVAATDPNGTNQGSVGKLERGRIDALFPRASDADIWGEFDKQKAKEEIISHDADIAFLRGADFNDLASATRFSLPTGEHFTSIIELTLKSALAKELVKGGYLDRNFALYAAQFYGDFTGVDVARFMVQSVETNSMDIDHSFSGPAAIANLLAEAPDYFTRTISAYNTAVLDYLLIQNDARAKHIAETVETDFGEDAQKFVRSYLNSGSKPLRFVALLAERSWANIFTFLVQDMYISNKLRPSLVSTALQKSAPHGNYQLDSDVRDFIVKNYERMPVFRRRQEAEIANKLVALLKSMKVVLPRLKYIDQVVRTCVVEEQLYLLSAENVRDALGSVGGISIDEIREDGDVYDYCLKRPREYLTALESDSSTTTYSVLSERVLTEIVTKVADTWDNDCIRKLVAKAAPECRLTRLTSVPSTCWPTLADYHLFSPSVGNILAYCDVIESFDRPLAALVLHAGRIDATDSDADARMQVAVEVLNASEVIPRAFQRVNLVEGLELNVMVTATKLTQESGDLLALLLKRELIEDDFDSFLHFRGAGWSALEPAIVYSKLFSEFMTPELLDGFVGNLLETQHISEQIRDKVIANLAQYVRDDDGVTLRSAAHYVVERDRSLPVEQMRRVTAATGDVYVAILLLSGATLSSDEIVSVLRALGEPYSRLMTGDTTEFEVPFDPDYKKKFEKVFSDLKNAKVIIDFKKQRLRDVFLVEPA
jgi:hypothetical protein